MQVNYVFPIGRRCNSSNFVRSCGLSKFSGPMDYMFIDLQTAKECIEDGFSNFLSDIVVNRDKLLYEKNSKSIDDSINKIPGYFISKWNKVLINQNYLPSEYKDDIYDWDRMCVFIHHDLEDEETYKALNRRCDRLVRCLNYSCLFIYFTEIIDDVQAEINRILDIKFKYELFVVIFSTNGGIHYAQCDNVKFLVVRCENYEIQRNRLNDNDIFNHVPIYNKIKEIYRLDLLDKP